MDLVNPYSAPNPEPAEDPPLVAQLAVDGEGMTVEYEQTFDDLITMNELVWLRQRPRWNRLGLCGIGMWILAAVFLPGVWQAPGNWSASLTLFALGAFCLVLWVRNVVTMRSVIQQTLQHHFKGRKNLNLLGLRRITITPDFIISSAPLVQSAQRWAGVEQVVVNPDAIIILSTALTGMVLPRRAFNSDIHFREFAHQAQKYLAAHATSAVQIPLK